jgi:hypothetical protein
MNIKLVPKSYHFQIEVNNFCIGEFYREVDGFYYYEPTSNSGAYSEELLGALLSELQKLNAKWKKEINQYFENELKKDQV